jgi:hypothetical protein
LTNHTTSDPQPTAQHPREGSDHDHNHHSTDHGINDRDKAERSGHTSTGDGNPDGTAVRTGNGQPDDGPPPGVDPESWAAWGRACAAMPAMPADAIAAAAAVLDRIDARRHANRTP